MSTTMEQKVNDMLFEHGFDLDTVVRKGPWLVATITVDPERLAADARRAVGLAWGDLGVPTIEVDFNPADPFGTVALGWQTDGSEPAVVQPSAVEVLEGEHGSMLWVAFDGDQRMVAERAEHRSGISPGEPIGVGVRIVIERNGSFLSFVLPDHEAERMGEVMWSLSAAPSDRGSLSKAPSQG